MENQSQEDIPATEQLVQVSAGQVTLTGVFLQPHGADGVILFAHGSGSSRNSPRNRSVARALSRDGFATLLMDLLTAEEEEVDIRTTQLRFNIELLAERLVGATDWLSERDETSRLKLGYFGASTGAAAALVAAAERPQEVFALVSRGGRPDLAGSALTRVSAPTLLIVGSRDQEVLALNRLALAQLRAEKQLQIIAGATHLFEEPGALDQVARLAGDWFIRYLREPV
ncbi:MAG: dienelactone hydrolase family protein [Ktedonobacterales bacterium]